jgi:hypothetical protein
MARPILGCEGLARNTKDRADEPWE